MGVDGVHVWQLLIKRLTSLMGIRFGFIASNADILDNTENVMIGQTPETCGVEPRTGKKYSNFSHYVFKDQATQLCCEPGDICTMVLDIEKGWFCVQQNDMPPNLILTGITEKQGPFLPAVSIYSGYQEVELIDMW